MRDLMEFKKKRGITLIALVITIIVLLILAGVSLNLIGGNEGILAKATVAIEKNAKGSAEEEIKLVLNEWRIEKVLNRIGFLGFLVEKIESKAIDEYEEIEEGKIEIHRNGYGIVVDLEGNIIEEIQKLGPKPKIENIHITLEDGTKLEDYSQEKGTPLVINFDASIEGGEIISIEPNKPYTTDGNEEMVTFTITGKVNGDSYIKKVNISVKDKYRRTYESIEEAVSAIEKDGWNEIVIATQEENVKHGVDAIVYNEDLVLDGTTNVKGASLNDNVYEFGDAQKDVATEEKDAENTVILKVNGNITINEGVTLTACKSEQGYGGPKGLVIYCTGTITNHGEISMTARGARAEGQNIYLLKNKDNSYEYVPAIGAEGGTSVSVSIETDLSTQIDGNDGQNASFRQTGGGGSGRAWTKGAYYRDQYRGYYVRL